MRALLDVNVLIALLDPDHVHHRSATGWLVQNLHLGWASCPLTQTAASASCRSRHTRMALRPGG